MTLSIKQRQSIQYGDLKKVRNATGVSSPTLTKAFAGGSVTPLVYDKLQNYFKNV